MVGKEMLRVDSQPVGDDHDKQFGPSRRQEVPQSRNVLSVLCNSSPASLPPAHTAIHLPLEVPPPSLVRSNYWRSFPRKLVSTLGKQRAQSDKYGGTPIDQVFLDRTSPCSVQQAVPRGNRGKGPHVGDIRGKDAQQDGYKKAPEPEFPWGPLMQGRWRVRIHQNCWYRNGR